MYSQTLSGYKKMDDYHKVIKERKWERTDTENTTAAMKS